MSKYIKDVVDVDMTIGGEEWLLVDAKVTLSRNRAPNFVRIKKMAPKDGVYFEQPKDLLGNSFKLSVDVEIEDYRDAPGKYNSTLFEGNVANISSKGTGVYEAVIYDPSQQTLNTQAKGSVMNQEIELQNPSVSYDELTEEEVAYIQENTGLTFKPDTKYYRASEALSQALSEVELMGANGTEDVDIQLSETGKFISGGRGSFRGALDVFVKFDKGTISVGDILSKIAKETKSFWWFDREGTFHFGVPDANVHYPELIIDSSAGLTTPPYQSVVVVGSDVASENGYPQGDLNPDEPFIVGGNITISGNGEPSLDKKSLEYGDDVAASFLNEPTFRYQNRELITQKQAENAVTKIAQDLGEQYASGKLTTVGYPEVRLFDVIILPHANSDKKGKGNYNPRLPMGGSIFGAYKIVHKLNSSDGFVTDIHVAGLTAPASVITAPNDFLSDTGPREDAQANEEFKGIKKPPTAEELLDKADENASESESSDTEQVSATSGGRSTGGTGGQKTSSPSGAGGVNESSESDSGGDFWSSPIENAADAIGSVFDGGNDEPTEFQKATTPTLTD